jgi:hypothetical protein
MKKITLTFFILFSILLLRTNAQTITVIFHVIHGGQPLGTYPNLSQAQINSQIPVLNDDYAGIGFNTGTYPANAFTTWATNTFVTASSLDGFGRIAIANTGITFKLATTDSIGNLLAEPGIERINYITKGWTNPASFTSLPSFQSYMDGTIKPATTWNCSNYLNIWISDMSSAIGLLGYTPFPPGTTLPGITVTSTRTTDGVWAYAKCVGSFNTYPSGTYAAPYIYGRTLTHEIGHHLGLLHLNTCSSTDYCNDTPPNGTSSMSSPTCAVSSYPLNVGTCTGPISNSPDGEMFMNFMSFSEDCAMYMFTQDQVNRIGTAMLNSPYLNKLGAFSTGIKELNPNDLKVYPNPSNGKLFVVAKGEKLSMEISTVFGELILKKDILQEKTEIDLSAQPSGIYFVKIGTVTKKIIKE